MVSGCARDLIYDGSPPSLGFAQKAPFPPASFRRKPESIFCPLPFVQTCQGFSSPKPQEMDPGFRRDDVGQEGFGESPFAGMTMWKTIGLKSHGIGYL
jgi:hypothetical protein